MKFLPEGISLLALGFIWSINSYMKEFQMVSECQVNQVDDGKKVPVRRVQGLL